MIEFWDRNLQEFDRVHKKCRPQEPEKKKELAVRQLFAD
jgi:hypothetical protein